MFKYSNHQRKTHIIANFSMLICLIFNSCKSGDESQYSEWSNYLGDDSRSHYSSLDQIDTSNVRQLKVAWTYHTGDASTSSEIQCNPIIVDGVLYGTSPRLKLLALDAVTGKEKWIFDPFSNSSKTPQTGVNRGVMYWSHKNEKRIFYTAHSFLYAIDAKTGKIIPSFGNQGRIDLHDGLDRDVKDLYVGASSPGTIYKDLLIMGSSVAEEPNSAPGHIRAYDVRTGEQKWIFHTIPHPGEFGYDTWENKDAWRYVGGTNNWAGMSLDKKRGVVYLALGSPSFDFWGGLRKGKGLFGNSVLALDAATGKYIWHYQTIHHDIWDRDLASPPNLVTIDLKGEKIDAVAQVTKHGFIFVLDRDTGEPLFPVDEVPVPDTSTLVGEKLWPTQPVPLIPKPVFKQSFTEKDINTLVPESSQQIVRERLSHIETGSQFIPLTVEGEGTVIFYPGFDGGAGWGGASYDPGTGFLYVNGGQVPWTASMAKKIVADDENLNVTVAEYGKRVYNNNCASCHGDDRRGSINFPGLLHIDEKYTTVQVMDIVNNGKNRMPAFEQLPRREKESLIAFLLDLDTEGKKLFSDVYRKEEEVGNPERSPFVPYRMTDHRQFRTPENYPANNPPWGTLTAIDLNTGEHVWQQPLGEYPELTKKGIPITGAENYGGAVVTAGGLIFIAATPDEKFRAFDKSTGKLLWEAELPAAGFATPATYEIDGKQYVVVACGGGKLEARSGDTYVAFALP